MFPRKPPKKHMNETTQFQKTSGRKRGPLSSQAIGAAWGRALGLALIMVTAAPAFAGNNQEINSVGGSAEFANKFSPELQRRSTDNGGTVTIIVQHRQMPAERHLRLMRERGARINGRFQTIRAVAMTVPVSELAELAKDANVLYVTPDRQVSATSSPVTEEFATAVQADVAASQYGLNGSGIGVALIDSGIAPNADLNNANGNTRVVYSQSFVSGNSSAVDQYGHGTHVAGLIGGTGASSGSGNGYAAVYAGIAPNVNLINLRALDQNGTGSDSQVIAAVEQAIALKNTYNIRVINMSLGRPVFESYTQDPQSIRRWKRRGRDGHRGGGGSRATTAVMRRRKRPSPR